MMPIAAMIGACAAAAVAAIGAGAPAREVSLGLAAPLAAAVVTWALMARTAAVAPERLTGVMLKAFAAKAVWFGAYVVVVLGGLSLAATPFIVSFTAFFIGVYVMEALFLQRLLRGTRYPRDADTTS